MSKFKSFDLIIENCMHYNDLIENEFDYFKREKLIDKAILYLNENMPSNSNNKLKHFSMYLNYLQQMNIVRDKFLNLSDDNKGQLIDYIGIVKYDEIVNNINNLKYDENLPIKELKLDLSILADALITLELGEIISLKDSIYNFVSNNLLNNFKSTSFNEICRKFGYGKYAILHEENIVAGLNLTEDVLQALIELFNDNEIVIQTVSYDEYIEEHRTVYKLPNIDDYESDGSLLITHEDNVKNVKLQWSPTILFTMESMQNELEDKL